MKGRKLGRKEVRKLGRKSGRREGGKEGRKNLFCLYKYEPITADHTLAISPTS